MGTRVAAPQVIRRTVRNATSLFTSPHARKCPLQPLPTRTGLLCSYSSQDTSLLTKNSHEPGRVARLLAPELSLRSFVDMGFTETQAEEIQESLSKTKGGNAAKYTLSTLTALFVLGLNPRSVMKLLTKCPELYTIKEPQLQQRISNLRKLGLVEGSLQRMVVHYPKILTVPAKTVKLVVVFLREKCLFTVQQVTDILRDSPTIVLEDLGQLEYKFQYVYFRMGVKQAEMVKSRLFRFTLEEVHCRHCFLERRGLYQTPDKKGQTIIINPTLDSILHVDKDTFLAHVAKASLEEYDVFQRLEAREWQAHEQQQKHNMDVDRDEEDEEEEERGGKSSYQKRGKRKQCRKIERAENNMKRKLHPITK